MTSQSTDYLYDDESITPESLCSQREANIDLEIVTAITVKRSSISKTIRCYKFTLEKSQTFATWWQSTPWFYNNEKKSKGERCTIYWASQDRKSDIWNHIECQAAEMSGGQPYVICSRCEHALAHPSIGQGTSTFSKHLTTNVYKKKANTKGLKQLNLQATIPEQVNNSL